MSLNSPICYSFDRFTVEPHTARLLRDGVAVEIEPKAFRVLLVLLEHRARLVEKEELLETVWAGVIVTENALTRSIARLRRALGDDPRKPLYIATVHSRGYRFLAPVELRPAAGVGSGEAVAVPGAAAALPSGPPAEVSVPEGGSRARRFDLRTRVGLAVALLTVVGLVLYGTARDWGDGPALPAARLDPKRVAVLPLADLGGSDDSAHVAEGFTEQMISALSELEGVRTVPRTSVEAYRESGRRSGEIGRELGVGTLLEGSLSRDRDRFRLTLRVVDVEREEIVWSHEYLATLEDLFDVKRQVVVRVGELLEADIPQVRLERIVRVPTHQMTAYEHYLRGRAFYRQGTRAGNEKAIEHYRSALELDSEFALALAGLANAHAIRVIRYGFEPDESRTAAMTAAEHALELDPDLPEAYKAIGLVEFNRSRLESALAYTSKALELDPHYDEAIANASSYLYEMGRLDEALLLSLRSRDRSLSLRMKHIFWLWELGLEEQAAVLASDLLREDPLLLRLCLYLALRDAHGERYAAARDRLERLRAAYPSAAPVWAVSGEVEHRAGQLDQALAHFEHALEVAGADARVELKVAAIRIERGSRSEAEATLREVERAAREAIDRGSEWREVRWWLAAVAALRGDGDAAVHWYARAVDLGHRDVAADRADPIFAAIRSDPRFVAQLDRVRAAVRTMRESFTSQLGTDVESFVAIERATSTVG